jgi:hypothetical protein
MVGPLGGPGDGDRHVNACESVRQVGALTITVGDSFCPRSMLRPIHGPELAVFPLVSRHYSMPFRRPLGPRTNLNLMSANYTLTPASPSLPLSALPNGASAFLCLRFQATVAAPAHLCIEGTVRS